MLKRTPNQPKRFQIAAKQLLLVVTSLLSTACTVFGVESVEEAPYKLVLKDKQFEIREYDSYVIAETLVEADFKEAGNKAFRRLFRYISGANQASEKISMTAPVLAELGAKANDNGEKIAMTAPVIAQKDADAWRYAFVLPKTYSLDNAPKPTDPDVSLEEIPAKRVATVRYSGRATNKNKDKFSVALSQWIASQGLIESSPARWAGYNAPWTLPPFRRNEVLIDVLEK